MATELQDQPQTAQTAQEVLAQASKKLEEALKEVGPPNEFAILLQELLEVSTKVAQFDEMTFAATAAAISEEAQTWKEISMMTLQHCRMQLIDRQRSLIQQLQVLSQDGASLSKITAPLTLTTESKTASEVKSVCSRISPPPGLPSPSCAYPSSSPSDISSSTKATRVPPGLDHPSSTVLTSPPDFQASNALPKAKKKSSAKVTNQKQVTAPVARESRSPMLNLDAYDSD